MRDSKVCLVEEAINLIEEKINRPLWLENLSDELYVSKFHLHRLFKALTGKTLMSYVRGRRLSRSLSELLSTDKTIGDIGKAYCFDYEQSYARAFKAQFGISPAAFRSAPRELEIVNMYDTSALSDLGGGIFVEPRFCFVPEMNVTGVCTLIYKEDPLCANTAALYFSNNQRGLIPSRVNEHVYIGFGFPGEDGSYTYMPCVEVTADDGLAQPFVYKTFPAHMYAVFRYVGFHSPDVLSDLYIGDIYRYIETEWTPKTTFRRNNEYLFERMDTSICSSTYCEADVYIPVSDVAAPARKERLQTE